MKISTKTGVVTFITGISVWFNAIKFITIIYHLGRLEEKGLFYIRVYLIYNVVSFRCTEKWLSYTYCCCCLVLSLVWLFCDLMHCSPLGSSVHGISQARLLEWDAISFSKLYTYINLFFFRFFSHIAYYRTLNRAPCAIQ